jgi:hypothetical protein
VPSERIISPWGQQTLLSSKIQTAHYNFESVIARRRKIRQIYGIM